MNESLERTVIEKYHDLNKRKKNFFLNECKSLAQYDEGTKRFDEEQNRLYAYVILNATNDIELYNCMYSAEVPEVFSREKMEEREKDFKRKLRLGQSIIDAEREKGSESHMLF